MTWYSASVIFLYEYKDGNQDSYTILENTYLLEAFSDENALELAEIYAKEHEEGPDDTMKINGRPVILKYYGIKKLMEVRNMIKEDNTLDGAEVTYSEYYTEKKEDFDRLIRGESVLLEYVERSAS